MSNSYQRRQTFSRELKHQICGLVISGEMSMQQARNHFNVKGNSSILQWMRKFGYVDSEQPMSDSSKKEDEATLKARIKALEAQLKEEKLKTELLDTMIDLAEDQLNINIRKKSGTKQSKK